MRKHFQESIMFFTFQERKKRKFEKYLKETETLAQLNSDELFFEYIQTKQNISIRKIGLECLQFLSLFLSGWEYGKNF